MAKYEVKDGVGIIPEGTTEIGMSAFEDCKELTSVIIPNSVTEIRNSAFSGCSSLNSIVIPDSVTEIGQYAFSFCTGLTSIVLSNSLTRIDYNAFYGCSSLSNIVIPASVTELSEPFIGCPALKSIIVDKNNKVYDSRNDCNAIIDTESNLLLQGCDNTVIPDEVTAISPCAFYNCTRLKTISLPTSLVSIGDHAFMGCISLEAVAIPEETGSVGKAAFYGCKSLTQVELPQGVTIGAGAFRNCDGLAQQGSYVKVAFDNPSAVDPSVFGFSDNKKAYQLQVPEDALERFYDSDWSKYFMSIKGY